MHLQGSKIGKQIMHGGKHPLHPTLSSLFWKILYWGKNTGHHAINIFITWSSQQPMQLHYEELDTTF